MSQLKWTTQRILLVEQMRAGGFTLKSIAKVLNVTVGNLNMAMRRYNFPRDQWGQNQHTRKSDDTKEPKKEN